MSRTTPTLKLDLPDLGSSANWGNAINNNFTKIDQKYTSLYNEMVSMQDTLLLGEAYYAELKTEDGDPYKFLYIEQDPITEQYQITYYTHVKKYGDAIVGDEQHEFITYSDYSKSYATLNTIPSNIGAYVINDITFKYKDQDALNLKQGDLLIVTDIISTSDDSFSQRSFVVFPDTGFYIEPTVEWINDNTKVQITYTKRNYVEYSVRDLTSGFTLVPAYYFHTVTTWKDSTDQTQKIAEFSYSDSTPGLSTSLCASLLFYTTNGSQKQPIYIDYWHTLTKTNALVKIRIAVDKNIPNGLKCDVCIGYNIPGSVTETT